MTLHEFASLPEIVASLHERDLIRTNEVGHKEYRKKYNGKVIRIVISSNNEFISAFKDDTVDNKIETHPFNEATASVLNGASLEHKIEYIGKNVNTELNRRISNIAAILNTLGRLSKYKIITILTYWWQYLKTYNIPFSVIFSNSYG